MLTLLLAACSTTPIHVGPPDLDTTSERAPTCSSPSYPGTAYLANIQGVAVVAAQVASGGRITRTSLATSSGSTALDEASVQAVKYCHFKPLAPESSSEPRTVNVTVAWEIHAGFGSGSPVTAIGIQPRLQ